MMFIIQVEGDHNYDYHSLLGSSDVSSRTWPRPRGASRTKSSGLGLGLEIKSSAIM